MGTDMASRPDRVRTRPAAVPAGLRRTGGAALLALAAPLASAQVVPDMAPGSSGRFSGISGLSIPGAGAQRTLVQPGVRTRVEFSDNAARAAGGEQSGYKLEVSPFIRASAGNSRMQGTLNYQLRALHSSVDSVEADGLRHTLSANGNALLLGDWLGIQGSARSFFTNTSPFAPSSDDPATSSLNTTRVTTVSLSPYLQGRVGSFAEYAAQYTLTRTSTSSASGGSGNVGNLLGRNNEQVGLSLSSGPQFTRWGWAFSSGASRREYRDGLQLHSVSHTGTLYYAFSPELRVGLSASHLYIEQLTDTGGNNRGWGPGISVDWAPGRRTSLRMDYSEQYYGSAANLAFSHRGTRWSFGFNYSSDIYSSNNAGILSMSLGNLMSGGAYAPTLNPIFQELVDQGVIDPDDIVIGAGLLNDALVRNRTVRATLGYLLPRGSLSLTGFRTVRSTLLDSTLFLPGGDPLITSSFGRFETLGATLTYRLPFSSRTSANFAGTVRDVESLDRPDKARLTTLSATLTTRLDDKTSVSAGVRRTVQSGTGGTVSGYDNNTVFGTLDVRF